MSSPLPSEVERAFYLRHRSPTGWFRCAGYRRRAHGRFIRREIHIDHVKPEHEWPELAADLDNLQPLCIPCHKAKTAAEATLRAKGKLRRVHRRRSFLWRWLGWSLVIWLPTWAVYRAGIALGWHDDAHRIVATVWAGYVLVALAAAARPALRWFNRFGDEQETRAASPDPAEPRILAAAEDIIGKAGTIRLDVTARD